MRTGWLVVAGVLTFLAVGSPAQAGCHIPEWTCTSEYLEPVPIDVVVEFDPNGTYVGKSTLHIHALAHDGQGNVTSSYPTFDAGQHGMLQFVFDFAEHDLVREDTPLTFQIVTINGFPADLPELTMTVVDNESLPETIALEFEVPNLPYSADVNVTYRMTVFAGHGTKEHSVDRFFHARVNGTVLPPQTITTTSTSVPTTSTSIPPTTSTPALFALVPLAVALWIARRK